MARTIHLDIELLPEGYYLGTSEDVPGLVVEERTVDAVVETARHLSPVLLEWHEKAEPADLTIVTQLRQAPPIAAE